MKMVGWRLGARLLEEVTHAGGADADEHFDELGSRDREERHFSLSGDSLGEKRLAGARGANVIAAMA